MRCYANLVAAARALAIVLALSWLTINGMPANAQGPPAGDDSGVTVTVDGKESKNNVTEGDTVDDGDKAEDVDCAIPDVTIQMAGNIRSVLLAVNNDTCDTYVKEIVEAQPLPDKPSNRFSIAAGHK